MSLASHPRAIAFAANYRSDRTGPDMSELAPPGTTTKASVMQNRLARALQLLYRVARMPVRQGWQDREVQVRARTAREGNGPPVFVNNDR